MYSWQLSHTVMVLVYTSPGRYHMAQTFTYLPTFSETHTHTHTHLWAYRACVTDRAQPQASTPLVTNYLDTLIHSYTPLQTAILCSWIVVAAIPVMASISLLCRPCSGIDSVLEWSAMIPADDVEHYSVASMKWRKVGFVCLVSKCKIHSLISGGGFFSFFLSLQLSSDAP